MMRTGRLSLRESQESRAKYRGLLEAAPDAMVVVNPSGEIILLNVQAEKQFGYRRDELVGQQVKNIIPEGFEERLIADGARTAADALAQQIGMGIELYGRRKDGTDFPIEIMLSPLESPEGILVTAAIRNISVRKEAEAELLQAQKMEAVGRLAGGIAHDFNNLLTAILGYSDLLTNQLGPGSPLRGEVEEIRQAGERAAGLTRQLLAFSRRQILELKVLDLNDLVGSLQKMLHRLIGEHIALASSLSPNLRPVRADAGHIEQVIMNLVLNSRDAMPKGGKITIETSNVELGEAYAREHSTVRPGSYVMLAVKDTGTGMDDATRAHVFEPFFTTKERGKGTGLGLATVYGIVKQSGGHIWLYSEPGKGTTFKIYLPQAAGAPEALPAPRAVPPPRGTETILLVEDEDSVRKLVRTILVNYGYTVLEADEGIKALVLAQNHPTPIHLVLTDVVMPDLGGVELIERLQEFRPGVRVLFMSGYTDDSVVRHGLLDGKSAFLQKPFTPETLARKVREALS